MNHNDFEVESIKILNEFKNYKDLESILIEYAKKFNLKRCKVNRTAHSTKGLFFHKSSYICEINPCVTQNELETEFNRCREWIHSYAKDLQKCEELFNNLSFSQKCVAYIRALFNRGQKYEKLNFKDFKPLTNNIELMAKENRNDYIKTENTKRTES